MRRACVRVDVCKSMCAVCVCSVCSVCIHARVVLCSVCARARARECTCNVHVCVMCVHVCARVHTFTTARRTAKAGNVRQTIEPWLRTQRMVVSPRALFASKKNRNCWSRESRVVRPATSKLSTNRREGFPNIEDLTEWQSAAGLLLGASLL